MASRTQNPPGLSVVIALMIAAIFVVDVLTPTGFAIWVFYVAAVVFCKLLTWRPNAPIEVASAASALVIVGYVLQRDRPAELQQLAELNRGIGVVTLMTLGIVGRLLVLRKIKVTAADWLKAGQNGLAAKLQGEQSLADLGKGSLGYLSEYVGAQVGAIYTSNDSGNWVRCAGYAREGEGPENGHEFKTGEGLVGQCASDKRVMVVDNVPAGYVQIRSGLGAGTPKELILVPTRADSEVNGVIELGFFSPQNESVKEFLGTIAGSVGVAFRSAKYRARQAELLEETQRQAEELQIQQEELKAANEELEGQARALKEYQVKLESQQSELEETNAQLEEQAQALESQKEGLVTTQMLLKQKAAEIERASRYKSEFLANMSHELRTPLNSSLILAKLLMENREGNLTLEQTKYAESIYSAGNDLLALINDVLDLSKIESGKVDLNIETVSTEQLLDGLKRRFEPLAVERKLGFRVSVAPKCPESFETDLQRLQQILTNLLSNALKFTEKGSIGLVAAPADGERISFTVEDTGIGIPPDQHEVIFEAFRQADGTTHRKFGGTGLGLSISRELAALLGGEIRLQSAPGKGSSFTVLVPVQYRRGFSVPRKPDLSAAPAEAIKEAKPAVEDDRALLADPKRVVLIIEDDPVFAGILRDLGHELKFQCLIAESAAEGLRLAREYRPVAVLLDMGLPDHSGLTVLELLKRDPATRHIPVHVVSVHDYQQVAREMGAVGYALKPVKREQLMGAFRVLEERLSRKVKSLLVVEDDRVQREAITKLLSNECTRIAAVSTAEDALVQLRKATFDCCVLDLMLPGVSGFELLERMSKDEACSFPPVIVYTGRTLDADEEHRLRRLSKSIIVKGARSPERLVEEATLFLHHVESELPPEQRRMLRAARDRESVFEGRRILVVEDDVRNIFALTKVLEPKGVVVEIARNGKESLARLAREPRVDLVLMDLMMPEMDGLEAMREIRKHERWTGLPIIALTAKAMPDDRRQCLAAGANDYIPKPVDVEKLLSLLRVWMPK